MNLEECNYFFFFFESQKLFTILILYLRFALKWFGDMSRVQPFEMFMLIIRYSGVLLSKLQTSVRVVLGIRIFFVLLQGRCFVSARRWYICRHNSLHRSPRQQKKKNKKKTPPIGHLKSTVIAHTYNSWS